MYLYELADWPSFTWDELQMAEILAQVKFQQGRLLGKMENLRLASREQATLKALTSDILKTSEIEGEILDTDQVRSSLARHLGIEAGGLVPTSKNVDGIVEMVLDATRHYSQSLTATRLFNWHQLLFPTSLSGMMLINVGMWRVETGDPMQVISGAYGREKVHFEAPGATRVPQEMEKFLQWCNQSQPMDLVIKAAIAHLWFVTIHPFDDGNGRIARAIADMFLTRSENQPERFYSMSAQIRLERKEYYNQLERTQKGMLDITAWLIWFLNCLSSAINHSETLLANILNKTKFWEQHATEQFNERQMMMLNKLFDGFKGKLTSSKWAKITKCSQDTAARDINDLIEKQVLIKSAKSGRSTHYLLRDFAINFVE